MESILRNFIPFFILCSIPYLALSQEIQAGESSKETLIKKEDNQEEKSKGPPKKHEENRLEEREKAPKPEKLLKVGNLAFPVSQQPNPLISFGQNLLNKKQVQALVLTTEIRGKDKYFIGTIPGILYGFTDDFSIFINAPIVVRSRLDHHHSSGVGDVIFQLEYNLWTKEHWTYYDQITVIANVTIPTGSAKKNPNTGSGSNSFFLGAECSRMGINWFYFVSMGGIFNTTSHRTKFGDQFLYQGGIGRRIFNTREWLFSWYVEIDGFYSCRDKIQGIENRNSGGNVIYVTPSLALASNESFLVQFGIGFPVYQKLFGHQRKTDYFFALNLGWLF